VENEEYCCNIQGGISLGGHVARIEETKTTVLCRVTCWKSQKDYDTKLYLKDTDFEIICGCTMAFDSRR
jgi:hypothetical protein